MKKKILGLVIAITALFAIGTSVSAATYINNEDVTNSVFTAMSDGYTLFPVRYLGEKLGCEVYWHDDVKCISVSKGDIHRDFYNGSPVVYDWNGNSYRLETAPKLVDGNTMVLAEFYRDHFGVSVIWDDLTKSLFINSEDTYNWLINTEEYKKATEPEDIFWTLTPEDIRNLNVFLSNFSEQSMDYYSPGYMSADELISFAFTHNNINNHGVTKWAGMNMGISAYNVDETLNKYFGTSVPRKSTSRWWYDGEIYWTGGASGEGYGFFSISNSLYDMKDGTYIVYFDTYRLGYGNEVVTSEYYWYTEDDAFYDYLCNYEESGFACIKPVVYNGRSTWQLLYLDAQ